ncbi:C-type lectin domain family 4 member A [Thomomys bottae]
MASEVTYAEVRFTNDSDSKADPPQAPKAKATTQTSDPRLPTWLWASLVTFSLLLAVLFLVLFILFFQKYSQLPKEGRAAAFLPHAQLECTKASPVEGKAWWCCPKNWHSFDSHCYLVSDGWNSWNKSREMCSSKQAYLMVVNSKKEQDFITKHLDKEFSYYLGLWDPRGQNDWQWVDGTPYNLSAT